MEKIQYDSFYKFLVSLGMILVALPIFAYFFITNSVGLYCGAGFTTLLYNARVLCARVACVRAYKILLNSILKENEYC